MPALRKVNDVQLEKLLDFLEQNLDLASGRMPTTFEDQRVSAEKWSHIAQRLNTLGYKKTGAGWKKYWTEIKYRVKKKSTVRNVKTSSKRKRVPSFSGLEERLLDIVGEDGKPNKVAKTETEPETIDIFNDNDSNHSDFRTMPVENKDIETKSNVIKTEHNLEKSSIADALFSLAKTQEDIAKTQRAMAETLQAIQSDINKLVVHHTRNNRFSDD